MTIFPGPTPPYTNPPIEPQFFRPSRFVITAISTGMTTTVTTAVDHNYVIGQEVRFLIPYFYGITQLNTRTGFVISIPSATQVVVDISSIGFDPFNPSPVYNKQSPQIVAIGDNNNGRISTTGRFVPDTGIPGAFENISP